MLIKFNGQQYQYHLILQKGMEGIPIKKWIRFLSIAKGSLYEVETQLYIAIDLKYLSEKETQSVMEQCNEIGKMITGLIKTLS